MRALRYGDDEHYDVVSAFIKSIRGSDADCRALLARPHARGRRGRALHRPPARDPRLGGRRDGRPAGARRSPPRRRTRSSTSACPRRSSTSPTRSSTWPAHRSRTAPTVALGAAMADVRDRPTGPVPAHLRDSHYPGAAAPWARRGVRLSSRHPRGLGASGVPAGRDRRAGVLPTHRSRAPTWTAGPASARKRRPHGQRSRGDADERG